MNEFRPCEIDGRPALFHRWVKESHIAIKPLRRISNASMERIMEKFDETSILPYDMDVTVIRDFYGLIEYPDGTVAKVDPCDICFKDTGDRKEK